MKSYDLKDMTIREVMEITRTMDIRKGGLSLIIEKIVMCIEELQEEHEVK